MTFRCRATLLASLFMLAPLVARAQSDPGGAPAPASTAAVQTTPAAAAAAQAPDPDLTLVPAEPDFALLALPTTLRMPAGKLSFRLTHRFEGSIGQGTAGDFFKNFLELDTGAQVGIELRYGIAAGTQVTVYRTSNRDIQLSGQHQLVSQAPHHGGASFDVFSDVEGHQNFSDDFSATIGGILSHRHGDVAAVYAEPMIVFNSNPAVTSTNNNTFMFGLGARVRLGHGKSYVVVEAAPRVSGYRPGVSHLSLGIEKRVGGHVFQLNFSNSIGTTMRQLAAGGPSNHDWFIGFNLTRKFF